MILKKTIVILETNPPSAVFRNTSAHASWFVGYMTRVDPSLEPRIYKAFAGELPETLDGIDGVIITGSSKEVYDSEGWIGPLSTFIGSVRGHKIPILGVCFGLQLLAQSAGGLVTKNPRGREVGTKTVQLSDSASDDPLFVGIPKLFAAQESHQSSIERLPEGTRMLADNSFGVQAFRFLNEPTWGVQFHPEVAPDILRTVVHFRKSVLESEGIDVSACLREIGPTPEAQKLLSNFIRIVYDHKKG